jgi:hypothetical protein
MDLAELEALDLYDPDAPKAADRLALIAWLLERGFTLEQMADAQASGSLTGLAGDHVIRPGRRLTLAEVAERAGLRPEDVESIRRASGFPAIGPDERDFSEADAESLELFKLGAATFSEEEALRLTRVVGSSLARIAETAVAMFLTTVEAPLVAAGGGELELAKANVEAASIVSVLPPLLDTLFRVHMEAAVRRSRLAARGGRCRTRPSTSQSVSSTSWGSLRSLGSSGRPSSGRSSTTSKPRRRISWPHTTAAS